MAEISTKMKSIIETAEVSTTITPNDILEYLTVENGMAKYIDGSTTDKNVKNVKKSKQHIKDTYDSPDINDKSLNHEEHHEEHYETYDKYCIHMEYFSNQNITMCKIGQDITKCASCPYRKLNTIRVKITSVSKK